MQLEKQSCLNEIDQVVVLRYDQIRASAVKGCTGPEGLSKCVIFPEQMLKRLRKRVLEIQEEIRLQKLRAKLVTNIIALVLIHNGDETMIPATIFLFTQTVVSGSLQIP